MDYHCERVNRNGIVFIFKISVGSYLFFSLLSQLDKSNESTLVVVHVYYTHLSLSFQSDSLIYFTKNQSNHFVEDAKTSTLLNLHDTDLC